MRLKVMIILDSHGNGKRHYVVEGFEVSLCGHLVSREPQFSDRYLRLCRRCDGAAEALRRKE